MSSPTETQTDTPTNAGTARVGAGTGGRVLDKAVQDGVSTGNRNLDLLLEMRRSDAADGGKPVNSRVEGAATSQPGNKPTPSQAGNRAPLPSPSQNILLGSDASGTQLRAELLEVKRDLFGEGSPRSGSAGNDSGRPLAETMARNANAKYGDEEAARLLPWTVIDFLRDNRTELLIALALLVLVGAGLKAYSRRI